MKAWPLSTLALVAAPLLAVQPESIDTVREDPFALAEERRPASILVARPHDEAVRQAIRDTLAERPDGVLSASSPALSGGAYHEFARQFSAARKTHCLGPDPLKHQPHSIETRNWTFGVGGLLAAPFWAAAIVRGKCNWR